MLPPSLIIFEKVLSRQSTYFSHLFHSKSIMPMLTADTPLISHSTPKMGHPPAPGRDPQLPLLRAFERFCSTISQTEKASFSGLTLNDVFARLELLDRVHFSSSKVRRLITRLEPFLYFLDRHGKALDSIVQVYPNPSAFIWGSLRVLLEVKAQSLLRLFTTNHIRYTVYYVVLTVLQKPRRHDGKTRQLRFCLPGVREIIEYRTALSRNSCRCILRDTSLSQESEGGLLEERLLDFAPVIHILC